MKGGVEFFPLAVVSYGGGREAFLAKGARGDDVEAVALGKDAFHRVPLFRRSRRERSKHLGWGRVFGRLNTEHSLTLRTLPVYQIAVLWHGGGMTIDGNAMQPASGC